MVLMIAHWQLHGEAWALQFRIRCLTLCKAENLLETQKSEQSVHGTFKTMEASFKCYGFHLVDAFDR